MRVALCQLNTTVGDFSRNLDRIDGFLRQASAEKADIAVFPELSLCSYPPLDLLDRPGFIEANERALSELGMRAAKIEDAPPVIIVGSVIRNASSACGRALCNAAVVLHRQQGSSYQIAFSQAKRLLPTYDVFDEARYFEPGASTILWDSPYGKLGLCVCEDAWFENEQVGVNKGRELYGEDPACALQGANLVINLSASPFELTKRLRRRDLLAEFARRAGAPLIYVNQIGANDEILFDGGSLVYSARGEILFQMPAFQEGLSVVDFEPSSPSQIKASGFWRFDATASRAWEQVLQWSQASSIDEIEILHDALVTGIRDYFRKTGFERAVLGLSGGIDSAVVACLAAEALGPKSVLGLSLPSQYSSSHSLADAAALASAVGLDYKVFSLKFVFSVLLLELKPVLAGRPADATEENMQARLRCAMIMAAANRERALALSTGNKSELAVGFCTIYGDMAGALAPLGDVYKTKVYDLARFINSRRPWIPQSTLTKPPSAELRPNQTDQDSLPPYDLLDRILELHLEQGADEGALLQTGIEPALVQKILQLVRHSEFKRRQAAPVLKVTSKAFGIGRRIPVVKGDCQY